jgi:hypothetical protein|tara:strand:- start:48428 stop:48664 length:237 start_codon:yes stop_codon:yes gene_type:complete
MLYWNFARDSNRIEMGFYDSGMLNPLSVVLKHGFLSLAGVQWQRTGPFDYCHNYGLYRFAEGVVKTRRYYFYDSPVEV